MTISVNELFSIPLIYGVGIDLSPDGKTLLYSSNASGAAHLYISQTKHGSRPKQITHGNDPVRFGFLSPSGNQVLYLQDKDGNELHHLFLTSKNGTKTKRITKSPCRTWSACWDPRGKEIARSYTTQKSCGIEIFNVKTGENSVLIEQEAPLFDVAYSHDGKWIACTEYGGGKDPKNMQVTILKRNDPKDVIHYKFKDGSKEVLPSWSPDSKKLAFLSDVKGKNQVVIQDFKGTDRQFLPLKEGEEAVDFQRPCWNAKSDAVYYAVSKHSRTCLYKHQLNKERAALPFPDGTILFFKVSKDGKTVVALHSSLSSPHCIYLNKIGSKTIEPLTSRKYKANPAKLAKPKSVWYESSDGLKIHAWYLPAGHGQVPQPAVVWPHGGPTFQTYDVWDPSLQSISQSGFAVLAPNFRGSTGYGAEFRNMNLSDLGGGDLEDVVAGAKWLAKQREIDKSKIAVLGGSYGGYMTLIALTKKPEVFAAGVAYVPIGTDWVESYELSDATFRKFDEECFGGPPEKRRELYRDRSAINFVSKIKAPVLITAGRNDPRCPIQPIDRFVKKLEEMKHPHKFIVEEKEGHGSARVDSLKKDVTTGINYLKKTLNVQ
jgi:dipeptidyl aminopeptidase/acylaminoacyl peptidase